MFLSHEKVATHFTLSKWFVIIHYGRGVFAFVYANIHSCITINRKELEPQVSGLRLSGVKVGPNAVFAANGIRVGKLKKKNMHQTLFFASL